MLFAIVLLLTNGGLAWYFGDAALHQGPALHNAAALFVIFLIAAVLSCVLFLLAVTRGRGRLW